MYRSPNPTTMMMPTCFNVSRGNVRVIVIAFQPTDVLRLLAFLLPVPAVLPARVVELRLDVAGVLPAITPAGDGLAALVAHATRPAAELRVALPCAVLRDRASRAAQAPERLGGLVTGGRRRFCFRCHIGPLRIIAEFLKHGLFLSSGRTIQTGGPWPRRGRCVAEWRQRPRRTRADRWRARRRQALVGGRARGAARVFGIPPGRSPAARRSGRSLPASECLGDFLDQLDAGLLVARVALVRPGAFFDHLHPESMRRLAVRRLDGSVEQLRRRLFDTDPERHGWTSITSSMSHSSSHSAWSSGQVASGSHSSRLAFFARLAASAASAPSREANTPTTTTGSSSFGACSMRTYTGPSGAGPGRGGSAGAGTPFGHSLSVQCLRGMASRLPGLRGIRLEHRVADRVVPELAPRIGDRAEQGEAAALAVHRVLARRKRDVAAGAAAPLPHREADQLQARER